ncbi:MAG: capsular polysaccharide biosynthesis protein, partial [Mangrovicoccus sp.]
MQRGPPTKPGQLPLTLLSSGLWRQRPIRRILELSGFHPTLSPSAPSFGIWGRGATSRRIMRLAQSLGRSVITLEEPFLCGPQPGRLDRRAPLGLLIDDLGVHYDAASPSRLETLLAEHP